MDDTTNPASETERNPSTPGRTSNGCTTAQADHPIRAEADPPPPVGNAMFVHNMDSLWRIDADLALRVDAIPDGDRLDLEPTRSGHWTARMPAPDGASVYLHSRYDPVRDAVRFVDSIDLANKFCVVVCGLGLGYHVAELASRLRGDAFVVCLEPSLELIATALSCTDLADAIRRQRIILIHNNDKAHLHERLKQHNTLMMLGLTIARFAPALRIAPEYFARMARMITDFAVYQRMSLVTLVANSRITCRNVAMNIPTYVTTPPIDVLKNRFRGYPGVVISAGPSLRRNVALLPELKDRAVLIAAQSLLKPLLERGIRPDFVTSLDFHEMSRKFFEDLGDVHDIHLVAEPKATWHVLDNYDGPVSLLDNRWLRLVLGDDLAGRDGLKAGATVAHLAFYLADYLGCNPIVFVGQDLAFTGHVFYVPGVEIHRSWRGEINRFNTMELKEWERIARNGDILHEIRGVDGGPVFTDELLLTYLEQFETDIARSQARVINATEGGANIRGTEVMSLRDVIDQFCTRPIPPRRPGDPTTRQDPGANGLHAAVRRLDGCLDELTDAEETCDELLAILTELESLTHDPARFNRKLARVDELRLKVQGNTRLYEIINMATQFAELRRYSADRRLNADDARGADRASRQLKRDIDFITGVREGAEEVRAILETARDRTARRAER